MRYQYFFVLIFFVINSCKIIGLDRDWNVSFYQNCSIPKNSITTYKNNGNNFHRFELKNGQIGGCRTDYKSRHSAPYWERVELKQNGFLKKNAIYEIKFKVRILKGFKGARETFFQIHQSIPNCRTGPVAMLKFDNYKLRLDAKRNLSNNSIYKTNTNIKDLINIWSEFRVIYNGKRKTLNVLLDDVLIFKDINFVQMQCGKPHIKFGIYRPGNKKSKIATSVIDFDEIKISKVKN